MVKCLKFAIVLFQQDLY